MGFLEIHNLKREALIKQCKNCRSATQAFGLSRPVRICSNRFGCEGKLYVVELKGSCRNFQLEKPCSHQQKVPLSYIEAFRYIPLTQGKFAIVDAEDYIRLNRYDWFAVKSRRTYYTQRYSNGTMLSMHREIMHAPKGLICDHKNHNGLDNRKSNLRLCTARQNARNRQARTSCSSRYKGVYWSKRYKKWRSRIFFDHKRRNLGYFFDEIKAALAYDDKAAEFFGEFAYLNFPQIIELRNWLRKIVWATSNR